MRSRPMVILEVLTEDPEQMPLAQHDEVIETFSSDRSDQPFCVPVLPGRSGCGQHLFDAHAAKSFAYDVPVGAVAVADEEARCLMKRERLDQLLGRPSGRGIHRDVEVHHAAPIEAEDHEAVEDPECDGRHGEEVDGGDVFDVVVNEGPPRMGAWPAVLDHVLLDRGLRDLQTKQRELIADPGRAPERVLPRDSSDHLPDLCPHGRPSRPARSRLPAPVEAKALAVPRNDRLGLDDDEG